jgi:hypothetical protein
MKDENRIFLNDTGHAVAKQLLNVSDHAVVAVEDAGQEPKPTRALGPAEIRSRTHFAQHVALAVLA